MSETLEFERAQNAPKSKQHFRSLIGKEFLIAEEFGGKDISMTISKVTKEELQNERGKENKMVLSFENTDRKIVCNVTNAIRIAEVLGTPYVGEWIGKKVTFYGVEITAFGRKILAIRIR